MQTIKKKKEEIRQENLELKKQTEEDNSKVENIYDPYYES